ncbi:MAG: M23 family metallopeptidase [Luteibaculaceae bacterium]
MFKTFWITTILLVLIEPSLYAQKNDSPFIPPVKIPIFLSGNFAELRSNHFHTGIDIKTQQREGIELYAIADAKLVRINISPVGYGKTLYFEHNNGITSVYAHLKDFEKNLAKTIKTLQYKEKTFALDKDVRDLNIHFKQGDLIGYAGNSGSSGGPHLHFELRETASQKPINPLAYFSIPDNTKPILKDIALIPQNNESFINGKNEPLVIKTKGINGLYELETPQTLTAIGQIGIAVNTHDLVNGSQNICGIYQAKLMVDSAVIFQYQMDKLNFQHQRFINAHTLFDKKKGNNYHRLHTLPNNPLEFYSIKENNGLLSFTEEKIKKVHIEIADYAGNTVYLNFDIAGSVNYPAEGVNPNVKYANNWVQWDKPYKHIDNYLTVDIPAKTLYQDAILFFTQKPESSKGTISTNYRIGDENIPLHTAVEVSLLNTNVPKKWHSKIVAVSLQNEKITDTYSVNFKEQTAQFKTRNFGVYALALDTIAPTISVNYLPENTKGISAISFTVSDNLSGVSTIHPTLNGNWILYDYDPKNKKISIPIDPEFVDFKAENELQIKVTDKVGNQTILKRKVNYL